MGARMCRMAGLLSRVGPVLGHGLRPRAGAGRLFFGRYFSVAGAWPAHIRDSALKSKHSPQPALAHGCAMQRGEVAPVHRNVGVLDFSP